MGYAGVYWSSVAKKLPAQFVVAVNSVPAASMMITETLATGF